MDASRLSSLLSSEYGFQPLNIEVGPRQFVAETFIVTTNTQEKYFVKVIPYAEFPRKIVKSLPVLAELSRVGLHNIPLVIPAKNRNLLIDVEKYHIVVFNFIAGEQKFEYDIRELANFLSRLHQATKKINTPIEKETFSSYVDTLFPQTFNLVFQETHTNVVVNELKDFLAPYENEIRQDWETFKKIIQTCKSQGDSSFCITHGDAPGNVIVGPDGKLSVIDWDDILLAPPERDLWFLQDKTKFMEEYRKGFPKYTINEDFYSYYVLWRMFDDLFGWIGEILADNSNDHKTENLKALKNDYLDWLRPSVRDLKNI